MLPSCTSTQKPFVIGSFNAPGVYPGSYSGHTQGEACAAFSVAIGGYMVNADQFTCRPSVNTYVYPVHLQCEVLTKSPFVMSVADGAQLTGLILAVWASAYAFRMLINVVRDKGEND